MATANVLIADITGSTKLYDTLPNQEALDQISIILARMRTIIDDHGGHCVKSKGDDTLSFFAEADQTFAAAREMIETPWSYGMAVHAGAFMGDVVTHDADLYGDAVNTAARLAALAKPKELLMGAALFDRLPESTRGLCVSMGGLKLKGKAQKVPVHSFSVSDLETQTVLFGAKELEMGPRTASVDLSCDETHWTIMEGQSVAVGRSSNCQAQLDHPWVSRNHGSFELRAAQLEYTDHSSSGSTVITADGQEYRLQRQSMLLNGEGMVLVGTSDRSITSSVMRYATHDLMPE